MDCIIISSIVGRVSIIRRAPAPVDITQPLHKAHKIIYRIFSCLPVFVVLSTRLVANSGVH